MSTVEHFPCRYKKQIEDAEEIAALNLAKYRKAQQQLEEAEDRSKNAEHGIERLRVERGASMGVSDDDTKLWSMIE